MNESPFGWRTLLARHYREARPGRHLHVVCDATGCTAHGDRWNPDFGEIIEHLRDDFWPAFKEEIVLVVALVAIVALSRAG